MKRLLLTLALFAAVPAFAQQTLPTEYTLNVYRADAQTGSPISSFVFQAGDAVCNLPITVNPPATTTNPRYIRWDDPAVPARECAFDTGTSSGVLFSMPLGGPYVAKLIATTVTGGVPFTSEASAASNPFVRGQAPAIPARVRVGS